MKTVKTLWNLGNFTVALAADVTDEAYAEFANRGALHLGQRNSEVDVVLGIVSEDEKGKKVRSKLTRMDVPYTPEKANALAQSFKVMEVADKMPVNFTVTVTPYDRDDTVSKEASAMALRSIGAHESVGDLEEWLLEKADYAGPTHTPDGEQYHPEAIAAVIPLARERCRAIKAAADEQKRLASL